MPRHKQMVKSANVEVAKGKRKCKFSGATITKGSVCLIVHDGPRKRFCYSRTVALRMIGLARDRLTELERKLKLLSDDDGG